MGRRGVWIKRLVIITVLGIALTGCAAMQKSDSIENERMLAAAGFQMKFADTPEKLAHLKTLPQRKLAPSTKEGVTHFMYADAEYCKCLYVGSEKAYQRYQKMAEKKQIAEMNEMSSMNWGVWGAWGPYW
jgi:hypothetical protein